MLDLVKVDSINSWFDVAGYYTYSDSYYNSARFTDRHVQWSDDNTDLLVKINFFLSGLQKHYQRQVYGIIDLLGDLGGVLEVIMVVSGALLFPISEHHFTLQASKRMFLVRSEN